jgi:hypothetical protein
MGKSKSKKNKMKKDENLVPQEKADSQPETKIDI